jgi:tetratricopeptide (TPR) repeat protein
MMGILRRTSTAQMAFCCAASLILMVCPTALAKEPTGRPASSALAAAVASLGDVAAETSSTQIARLIQQLGDQRYILRQQAQEELSRLGPEAFDALSEAQNNDDIEIASRAKYLVQRIRVQWTRDTDSPQIKRFLSNYESKNDIDRLAVLGQLSKLPGDMGLEPLCRLVRFEKSPLVSKQGALLLLGKAKADAPDSDQSAAARTKTVETALGSSTRPAARWLRVDLQLARDPEGALPKWNKLVEDELATLENSAGDTNNAIVLALQRRQVEVLLKLKQQDRALEAMRKMIVLQTDDPQSLSQLVDWLVKKKAWPLIDELAARFVRTFNSDPILLYSLAQARQVQGNNTEAESLAKRAYQLNPQNFQEHFRIGRQLQERSLFDWSEREYRHVIGITGQESEDCIKAEGRLSEMLHDQQRDLAAAKVLQKLVDAMNHDAPLVQKVQQVEQVMPPVARMHYFYACHYGAQNDREEQWKHLEEGIAQNPGDTELLIEMYRASADNPQRHKRVQELVRDAVDKLHNQIAVTSDDGLLCNLYNEYAWLVGNTEGDLDLAIQYSLKSIELARQPEFGVTESGYLDTLAHCYARKGDYESAVKYQTRAVELEPFTLQIVRALDQFKAGLEKSRHK